MARQARLFADGNWHHVFNRGARRWPIYQSDGDRRTFLRLVAEVVEGYRIEIHAFCQMGNHYHFIVRAPIDQLSSGMGFLSQMYTQQFNHHHGVDGPLFRGRFGSVPIVDDRQLLTTVRYVARNPLDLAPSLDLDDYRWSSHQSYLGLRQSPAWLSTSRVLKMAGGPSGYRKLVEAESPNDPAPAAAVRAAVIDLTGASPEALFRSRRNNRNDARLLLVLGLVELAGMTAAQVAATCGFSSASAARSSGRRAREFRRSAPDFAALWDCLESRLAA